MMTRRWMALGVGAIAVLAVAVWLAGTTEKPLVAQQPVVAGAEVAAETIVDGAHEAAPGVAAPSPAPPETPELAGFMGGGAAPEAPSDPTRRTIAGWVVDGSGEPLVDVVVTATDTGDAAAPVLTVLSDEEGRFVFASAGRGLVRLKADGEALGLTSLLVADGGDVHGAQLTLEAGARIVVTADADLVAEFDGTPKVVVRSWSPELTEPRFGDEAAPSLDALLDEAMRNGDFVIGGDGHEGLGIGADGAVEAPVPDDGVDEVQGEVPGDGESLEPLMGDEAAPSGAFADMELVANLEGMHAWDGIGEVARGAPGEALAVKAGLVYQVVLETEEARGVEVFACGEVRPIAGETIRIHCSNKPADAFVAGRIVDVQGRPLAGVAVKQAGWFEADMPTTTSGADGRFVLTVAMQGSSVGAIVAAPAGEAYHEATVRNVGLVAGHTTEVGDILVMQRSEVPIGWMDVPFGGTGGLVTLNERGVYLQDVEPDCPLAALGVDPGDTITRIEGLDAGRMEMDEVLKRLRGDPGTKVGISVRNSFGETVDLVVTRGVIRPGRESWPELDVQPVELEALHIEGEHE